MYTIHKFEVDVGENKIFLSSTARILHAGEQRGRLYIWAVVNTEEEVKTPRKIFVHGTGFPLEGSTHSVHIGTVQMETGLVFHVFE